MKLRTHLLILLLLLIPGLLLADTVILKTGQTVEGRITAQTRTSVTIRTTAGAVRTIQKEDIRRISYGATQTDDDAQKEAERRERLRRDAAISEENKRIMEQEWRRIDEERKRLEEDRRRLAEEWARLERGGSGRRPAGAAPVETPASRLRGAFIRSMVLPGWGQLYQGRDLAGYAYLAAFAGLAGGSLALDEQYYQARQEYEKNANVFLLTSPAFLAGIGVPIVDVTTFYPSGIYFSQQTSQTRASMETAARRANFARSALAAFYVWNLVDVVLFAPSENQSFNMSVSRGDSLDLRFDYRF